MNDWLEISIFQNSEKYSTDFLNEIKTQISKNITENIGTNPLGKFLLMLDAYPDMPEAPDTIYADLVTPENFGYPVDIKWVFTDKKVKPTNFNSKKNLVNFKFSDLPITEIKKCLKSNKNLPFKTANYTFSFKCYHFYGFKDITININTIHKKDVIYDEFLKAIENTIKSVIIKWNKEKNNPDNHVDYIGDLTYKEENQYNIFIDVGTAQREIIGLILKKIDLQNQNRIIKKIVLY